MTKNELNHSRCIIQKLLYSGERLSIEELTDIFDNQEVKEKLLTFYFLYRAKTPYTNNKDDLDMEIVLFIKNFLYKDLLKTNNPEIMLIEEDSNFDKKTAYFDYLETTNNGSTFVSSTRFTLNLSKTNTTLVGKWINAWKTEIKNDYDKIENQEDAIQTTIRRLVGEGDKDALNSAIKLKNSSLAESEQTALQKRNSISIRSFNDATEHLKIMEEQCNRFAKNFLLQTEVLSPETMKEYLVKHFDKLIEANKTKR